ncbi:hypothetical protein [Sphingomonas sp.]|uniref:hypothetical protein n=1 Tax=Sphingomonas sp. TaxID=28214 RepID=UPI0038B0A63E
MRLRGICESVVFLLALGAHGNAASAEAPQSAPAALQSPIQSAIDRGRTMYLYDGAAWVTSDDIVTRLPHERGPEVGGWIVTPVRDGFHVDYFGKNAAADHVVYAADVNGQTVSRAIVYAMTAEPMLKEPALHMARALRAAWVELSHHPDWRPCTNSHFNTIVLPPQLDGTIPVYFLTPQTEAGSFPFGGHYEIDIGADGRTKLARAFTRSCLNMTKPRMTADSSVAMMFLTHSMDAQPTEIHVLEQYYVGVPVVVGIIEPRSFWKVENGTIENVSDQIKQ